MGMFRISHCPIAKGVTKEIEFDATFLSESAAENSDCAPYSVSVGNKNFSRILQILSFAVMSQNPFAADILEMIAIPAETA